MKHNYSILLLTLLMSMVASVANATETKFQSRPMVLNAVGDVLKSDAMPAKLEAEVEARLLAKRAAESESNQYVDEQGVVYQLYDDGQAYAVTGHTDDLKSEIVIASEVNGLPVTRVGQLAFYKNETLTSVTISEGITSLDYGALASCPNLSTVSIPQSVTYIDGYVFYYCSALTSITIPDGVTSLGEAVFYCCTSLVSVTLPNNLTTIGEWAFCGCTGLTSLVIPDGVTSIGGRAFTNCDGLTSITIPNSVTSIGDGAFNYCI